MNKNYLLKMNLNIKLNQVTKNDMSFLYELLKNKDPNSNISHKKMPSYNSHIRFIKSKPYKVWYIIYMKLDHKLRYDWKEKVGSIYLSKNDEIGIFVSNEFQGKNIGKLALSELMKQNPRQRYLANVSPKNKKSTLRI